MAIIKVLKRENPYVQIDKIGVDDSNLSWEATGLLTYLIGRPNNWKINIAHLASVKKNKETSTRNALLELRKAKYCHYFEVRKSGKIVETFYLIFEIPTEHEEIKSNIDYFADKKLVRHLGEVMNSELNDKRYQKFKNLKGDIHFSSRAYFLLYLLLNKNYTISSNPIIFFTTNYFSDEIMREIKKELDLPADTYSLDKHNICD